MDNLSCSRTLPSTVIGQKELITTNEVDSGSYVALQQASVNVRVRLLCSEVEYDVDGNWTSLATCGEFPKHDSWTHWGARSLQMVETNNL